MHVLGDHGGQEKDSETLWGAERGGRGPDHVHHNQLDPE